MNEDEIYDGDIYDGEPDDVARDRAGKHDEDEPVARSFVSAVQRTTAQTLEWYTANRDNPPFDPDGMCLKVCRTARNIPAVYASAKEAQDATPMEYRYESVSRVLKGMVAYFDTVGDSNPFGHIVTVRGRIAGVPLTDLNSLAVETNSVVANKLVVVRGGYFRDHWGDKFQFGATWLNGQELDMPEPPAQPAPTERRLHLMHTSLQTQDTPKQIANDLTKIFNRAHQRRVAWITGTEAFGPKTVKPLEAIGGAAGFRVERPAGQDCWIAVRKSLIAGKFGVHWEKIVEGGDEHRDLGVLAVEFDTDNMGHFTVLASHLLTQRQTNATRKNNRVLAAVAEYAEQQGRGSAKVFYGGDQNKGDKRFDTFNGHPFTSFGDEKNLHEPTHPHGRDIDVMATYDPDTKVKVNYLRVLDDTEFPLHGDHFVVEGGVTVGLI